MTQHTGRRGTASGGLAISAQGRHPAPASKPTPSTKAVKHEVRIIGGLWKRSKLQVADAPGLRPTPNRVRETLFNWLGPQLQGWLVLDAFAGTGALGFEAASRGAAQVLMLDTALTALKPLQASKARLQAAQVHIHKANALEWMRQASHASNAPGWPHPATFDLILLDPPFGERCFEEALTSASRLLREHGFVYLESDSPLPPPPQGLGLYRQSKAGAVFFGLYQRLHCSP